MPSSETAINGDAAASPNDSLFGGNDGDSLFGDNDNEATSAPLDGAFLDDEDDEFSRAIANGMREQEEAQEQERVANQDAGGDTHMPDADRASTATLVNGDSGNENPSKSEPAEDHTSSQEARFPSGTLSNGLPHAEEVAQSSSMGESKSTITEEAPPTSDSTFLAAGIYGSLRIWDKRQPKPIAKMLPQKNVPPWCTSAVWSPDGNFIYAGRRNGTVEEYSLHKGLRSVERSFKLPNNSGAVSALRAMPNGRHLIW